MPTSEEKTEAFKAFKDLLVPPVRDALQQNEAEDKLYFAAHYAYVLQDMVAGRRLLLKILVKKAPKYPKLREDGAELMKQGAAGLLAVMIGESDIAEQIIQELEKDDPVGGALAIAIALKLPDKTTAKRLMRRYETGAWRGRGLKIAAEIGDKEVIKRWMQQLRSESQSIQQLLDEGHFIGVDNRCLMKAALYDPEFGKRFMKRIEHEDPKDQYYLVAQAGKLAAILGDRTYAKMVFNYFKEKRSSWFKLQAGAIAAALGDINAAEEMICKALSSPSEDFWNPSHCEVVGDIFTTLAKKNLKAAEKIWKIVEKEAPGKFYLVTFAAKILENLTERE